MSIFNINFCCMSNAINILINCGELLQQCVYLGTNFSGEQFSVTNY